MSQAKREQELVRKALNHPGRLLPLRRSAEQLLQDFSDRISGEHSAHAEAIQCRLAAISARLDALEKELTYCRKGEGREVSK